MAAPKYPFIGWDNRLADAVPVASSTGSGAAVNLSDFRPYTSWKPSVLPAMVTVDCTVAKNADYLAVFSHNLFSSGCSIELHGSTDNFAASDVTVQTFTPTADTPFVLNFNNASYRYWRIKLTGAAIMPTLAIVTFGVGMPFPVLLEYGFSGLDRKVFGQTNISEDGLPLGKAILFEQWVQQLNFKYVDNTWIRTTLLPAWKSALRGSPFIFAFDLINYPSEVYLVQVEGDLIMPSSFPLKSDVQFTLKGVALP